MKRYVGLTIMLISAVILSYMIFFSFHKNINIKNNINTGDIIGDSNVKQGTGLLNVSLKNDNDVHIDHLDIQQNTGNNTIDNSTGSNFSNTLIIGDITLYMTNDDIYDDIFELIGHHSETKYKVKGKKIYIKKIDSVDYGVEKSNMERLIQKIGGNLAKVNRFGDKQLFVNLDLYYKKDSISLVEYKDNLYFMILPYDKYYEYKTVIKEFLFK